MNFKRFFFESAHHILFAALIIVSLFLISVSSSPKSDHPKTFFFGVFAALNSAFSSILAPAIPEESVEQLRARDAELMLRNSLLRKYGLENERLKQLLAFKKGSDLNLLSAEIIAKDVSPNKSFVVIDRGLSDSVKPGMNVITDKGLLGIVATCGKDYSKVRTLMNGRSKVAVEIERTGLNGILAWDGLNLHIENIPSNYDILIGDRVVTSPVSFRFVYNIPVGIVTRKNLSVSGLLSEVIVKPFVDFRKVKFCFVVKNSSDKLNELSRGEELEK